MSDRDKNPGRGQFFGFARIRCAQPHTGDAGVIAEHFIELAKGREFHVAVCDLVHHLVDHDGFGPELVTAVYDGD